VEQTAAQMLTFGGSSDEIKDHIQKLGVGTDTDHGWKLHGPPLLGAFKLPSRFCFHLGSEFHGCFSMRAMGAEQPLVGGLQLART
jgi:hypothetical protein